MNPWAEHLGATEIDLRTVDFAAELLACIPAEFVRRYRVLPILRTPTHMWITFAPPPEIEGLDFLHQYFIQVAGLELGCYISEAAQIDEFIERVYGWGGSE